MHITPPEMRVSDKVLDEIKAVLEEGERGDLDVVIQAGTRTLALGPQWRVGWGALPALNEVMSERGLIIIRP